MLVGAPRQSTVSSLVRPHTGARQWRRTLLARVVHCTVERSLLKGFVCPCSSSVAKSSKRERERGREEERERAVAAKGRYKWQVDEVGGTGLLRRASMRYD